MDIKKKSQFLVFNQMSKLKFLKDKNSVLFVCLVFFGIGGGCNCIAVICNNLMTSLPILNQPIVFAALCAVSYRQHAVIQSGLATEKLVVYPGLVELEAHVTGINGNSDGADGSNGALKI